MPRPPPETSPAPTLSKELRSTFMTKKTLKNGNFFPTAATRFFAVQGKIYLIVN